MKKILLIALLSVLSISVKAQFAAGTKYFGASLTGLGLSYSSNQRLNLGVQVNTGIFVFDSWMLRANARYTHTRTTDDFSFGLGVRYYILQNGIFLGAGGEYVHSTPKSNDMTIPLEVGYAFYLNHYLTIEPSLYYRMSINDFSGGSTVGVSLGFGFYF